MCGGTIDTLRAWSILFGLSIAVGPAPALAQISNPVYANLYWEASGHTWDADIAAQASASTQGLGLAFMTTDMIDSVLRSALASHWTSGMAPYGVTQVNPVPLSFTIVPDALAASGVSACAGVTPNSSLYKDWDSAVSSFIGCALAAEPSLAAGNVVLNVFIPPWVGGDSSNDPCLRQGFGAYNDAVAGHSISVYPLEPNCGGSAFSSLTFLLGHETAETTTQQRLIADGCEGENQSGKRQTFQFLNNGFALNIGLSDYEQHGDGLAEVNIPDAGPANGNKPWNVCENSSGTVVDCNCIPQTSNAPSSAGAVTEVMACGAGRSMQIQAALGVALAVPPWDLPSAGNGYLGSLYFSALVLYDGPSGAWTAGGAHIVGDVIPVGTPWLQWSNGFFLMSGFGNSYGGSGNTAPPNTQIQLSLFDSAWGQPATLLDGTPLTVTAEEPNKILLDQSFADGVLPGKATVVIGAVYGSPTCGVSGHQVGRDGLMIGEAAVQITFSDRSMAPIYLTADEDGSFQASFTPVSAGPLTVIVTSGTASTQLVYQVYPTIASITPSVGLVTGGTPVTINGNGFVGGVLNNPTGVSFSAQAGAPGSAHATYGSVSPPSVINAQTPPSPLTTNHGVGAVDVSATILEATGQLLQSPSSVPYTYTLPYYPIASFQEGGNCVGGLMVLSAYDESLRPLSGGVLVRPNAATTAPLGDAFLGQALSVRARGIYYVQVDAGTVAGPVVPITVPSNLISYCLRLVWFPPTSYFGPESTQILNHTIVAGLPRWQGGDPAHGAFGLTLTVPVSSDVSNGLVAVIPTAAELQTLATSVTGTLINASGTQAKVQLAGTMFNLTARSQEGIFNPAQPEVFLPEPGVLTYVAPTNSSGPMTQYRVVHAMELSSGINWVDVTSTFGSNTLSANVTDEGWYALVAVTPAMALEQLPPPLTTCANGVCAACAANGFKTATAANCCSGQLASGACACLASGQACTSDQGCCSNWCANYVGGVGTCLPAPLQSTCQAGNVYCAEQPSQPCECAGQSASTVCGGNVCCSDAFGICPSGQADCCGGNTCVNGTCLISSGDGWCSQPQWTLAQQNASCTSGSCNTATGNCN